MTVWLIAYDDGIVYTDDDGDAEDAPAFGVQAIANADSQVGRRLDSRRDYYWHENGCWWGGDLFGLFDYLARPGWKKVVFGRYVPADTYNAALRAALEHPGLPVKSAWDDREHRPDGEG